MASLDGAYYRIRYLMGKSAQRSSPNTITGETFINEGGYKITKIYSYALHIGTYHHDTKEFWLYPDRSSMTTNRHIRACRAAFDGGYLGQGE